MVWMLISIHIKNREVIKVWSLLRIILDLFLFCLVWSRALFYLRNAPIEQILSKWDSNGNFPHHIVRNGHIKRLTDPDIDLPAIEISGTNILQNYLAVPANPKSSLKIKYPIIVLLVKNVHNIYNFLGGEIF